MRHTDPGGYPTALSANMSKRHLALLYLGIAFLLVGCATFLGGLGYLLWLIISEPAIIKNEFGHRIVTR